MTRILLWTDAFLPYIGGAEVLAARYMRGMQARGHTFAILTRRDTATMPERDTFERMPVYRFNLRAAFESGDPRAILQIRREINAVRAAFKPDVLHIYHVGMGAMFAEGIKGLPTLLTLHARIPARLLQPDSALATLYGSVDYVAGCSQSVIDMFRHSLPHMIEHSMAIPNALDMPTLLPTPLDFDPPRLLCIGRHVPVKGFDIAIRAFALLKARFPNVRLTLAGDGDAHGTLLDLAETLGLGDSVDFIGWVAPESVSALIGDHMLVLMPSREYEAFGLVALEAAQMARPVIASNIGGLPEVIVQGETGLLVEPDDPAAMAAAAETLLFQPELAGKMGAAGRERARTFFTWDAHLQAYDVLMQRLVASAAGA